MTTFRVCFNVTQKQIDFFTMDQLYAAAKVDWIGKLPAEFGASEDTVFVQEFYVADEHMLETTLFAGYIFTLAEPERA